MNPGWKAVTVIAGLAILAGVGAFLLLSGSPSPSSVPDQIRIGAPGLEQNALIYIALDRGFFLKNGLNVTLRDDYQTGVGPVSDMADGKQDLSVSAEYPVIGQIFSGRNVSIIASIDKYQNEQLIARKDSQIRRITDLRGKTIGLPRGTILEFFLGRLLELNGLGIGDVTLVDVNTSHAVDAIDRREVDAIMYFQPHTTRILDRLGDNAVVWPGQSNQSLYGVVAARNDWIESHPRQINKFLQSLEEAREYSLTHPDDTKSIVKRHLNLTDEYLTGIWTDHTFTLSLDQSLLVAMSDEGRWMVINNLTAEKAVPDFRSSISTAGLEKIKPVAVNIR